MNPAVSIVMPCYERATFLHSVFAAYDRQQGSVPFEVIAVDDGSTDATPTLLQAYTPQRFTLHPIILPRNQGPANARNAGIAHAQAPLIMFVGDDIVPNADFVQQHVHWHNCYSNGYWAILGKTIWPHDLPQNTLMRHIDGLGAQQFSYYYMRNGQEMDFRHFYTSNISLKRSLLQKVQPWFDTGFRYAAFEDVELGYRLEAQGGMRIIYTEDALTQHYHYYNIWGFSERQYRAGLMAAVFVQKYPHFRKQLQFRRVGIYLSLAYIPDVWRLIRLVPEDELVQIEHLALHLASFYELDNVQPLDRLYLLMLNYYVLKGMIDGDLPPHQAMRARRALLIVSYAHHIGNIVETLQSQSIAYPQDVVLSLHALIRRYNLPIVQVARRIWATSYVRGLRRMLGPGYEH